MRLEAAPDGYDRGHSDRVGRQIEQADRDNWKLTGDVDFPHSLTVRGGLTLPHVNGIDVDPATDADADLITVGVSGTPRLHWNEGVDEFVFTHQLHVTSIAGLHISGGGDADHNLVTVSITDTPKLWWDESEDHFVFTKGVEVTGVEVHAPVTFGADDATPSVANSKNFVTANANPTTITALDDGKTGQTVFVLINDANTTIDFTGTTLKGNAGADWTPANGDFMRCTKIGSNWYCTVTDATA